MKDNLLHALAGAFAAIIILLAAYHGIGRELCARGYYTAQEYAAMRLDCER